MTEVLVSDVIRILLLDDHPVILDGLAAFLGGQDGLEIVAKCHDPAAGLVALGESKIDVAIIDIKVGGEFSFNFAGSALERCPDLKLLFMTGFDDDVFLEKAFQAGGHGFVLKSEPLSELAKGVRVVATGERYVSPEAEKRLMASGDPTQAARLARQPMPMSSRLSLLTPREREVMHHVSRGLSAKEISSELKISVWTVTNHKANIMAKLGIHNQVGLARFAMATGLAAPLET